MRYCDGGSLLDLVESTRLTIKQKLSLLFDVARGMVRSPVKFEVHCAQFERVCVCKCVSERLSLCESLALLALCACCPYCVPLLCAVFIVFVANDTIILRVRVPVVGF